MANGNEYYSSNEASDEMHEVYDAASAGNGCKSQQPNRISNENASSQDTYAEILAANIGAYVLVQFLIGTTSLTDKEGYLYAVGTNFVTIYEPLDDKYVVCDLYSVKFVSIFNSPPASNLFRSGSSAYQRSSQGSSTRYPRSYSTQATRSY